MIAKRCLRPVQDGLVACIFLLGVATGEAAPTRLHRIDVTAPRTAGSAAVVDAKRAQRAATALQPGELLATVPGIAVRDRANAAQDLQVQSRGFGARSSFGIRGLRLMLDGLPVSANDGQGSLGNWLLPTLGRVEVLRGPQALMMGNAAGGVLAAHVAEPEADAALLRLAVGGDGQQLVDVGLLRRDDERAPAWRVDARSAHGQGARPHSAFERHQAQVWLRGGPADGVQWRWLANVLDAPRAQDPIGLTPTQWRQGVVTDPAAQRFNTRKSVRDGLLGGRFDLDLSTQRRATAIVYGGQRDVRQFLALPVAAQSAPGSAGGVIELHRDRSGLMLAMAGDSADWSWHGGVEFSLTDEARRGYENFQGERLGVIGALRRDERNRVLGQDLFASLVRPLPDDHELALGLRHSELRMRTHDRFLANGDDSGVRRFASTDASLSLSRDSAAGGRRWIAIGSGYEAPTLNELAYRSDGGSGLNDMLAAARSRMVDLGLSEPALGGRADLSLFHIDTRDDIVPAANRGGRASFRNAERTTRRGLELAFEAALGAQLRLQWAATWIDARFERGFSYLVPGESVPRVVPDGARIPGIAARQVAMDLEWSSRDARTHLRARGQANASLPADDRGLASAPGSARVDLAAARRFGRDWQLSARIDNLLDRELIGSVIVNEANARHFEPGPGRTFWLGLEWSGRP